MYFNVAELSESVIFILIFHSDYNSQAVKAKVKSLWNFLDSWQIIIVIVLEFMLLKTKVYIYIYMKLLEFIMIFNRQHK